MAMQLTDDNFKTSAIETDKLVLVDFWAAWCGPCKMLTPIIDELAEDYKDTAVIGKVDVDNNPQVSNQFGIRSLPTILFLKNGEIVDKHIGVTSKAVLDKKIQAHL